MANFQGIEDFVAAITGGGGVVPGQEFNRLVAQRSAQVSLDRKLEQLMREKDINVNRATAGANIEDELLRALVLGGPGLGANFSAGQRGLKTGIESEALRAALDAIMNQQRTGGEPQTDFINALTGVSAGKLSTPANVQVQSQATSDTNVSDALAALNEGRLETLLPAQVAASKALTGQRNAAAERSALPSNVGRINLENPSKEQYELLFEERKKEPGFFNNLLGTKPGTEDVFIFDEFERWRTERALAGEDVTDAGIAIQKFLASKRADSGAVVAGAGEAPASPTGQVSNFVRDANGNLVFIQ